MKKLFAFIAVIALLNFSASSMYAQDAENAEQTENVAKTDSSATEVTNQEATNVESTDETQGEGGLEVLHYVIKTKFIQGGAGFMAFVLICLILGLALALERIIYLNLATTNPKKLLTAIEDALENGGVEAAKEVCRNTKGPVASIFYQGLDRADEGIEMVEKSVISYGGVQMGLLEKGLSWVSLFIALAPMLGFMGTVIGMIQAFDAIKKAGDIQPAVVADGISVALITTVSGLIVAMILQVFYNYLVAKIDTLVNTMEDASISLIDILYKYNNK